MLIFTLHNVAWYFGKWSSEALCEMALHVTLRNVSLYSLKCCYRSGDSGVVFIHLFSLLLICRADFVGHIPLQKKKQKKTNDSLVGKRYRKKCWGTNNASETYRMPACHHVQKSYMEINMSVTKQYFQFAFHC